MTIEGLIQGQIEQEWILVDPHQVIVRERQRKINEEHVQRVLSSYRDLGGQLQLQPIVVDEDLVLIDGAHRLEAAKRDCWTHIRAVVFWGVTDEDRPLIEAEANAVRLQLTPLELEEAWKTLYEPAFKARTKRNQVANLKQGTAAPVTENFSNGEPVKPLTLAQAAQEVTGTSLNTINKITDIRALANSSTASPEIRAAAGRGLEKLKRPGAPVDPVHRSLIEMQERESRQRMDPTERQQQELEKRLDNTLSETTLLAGHLTGTLGADLEAAAGLQQANAETLRGIRIALTKSLAAVVSIECRTSSDDDVVSLKRLGSEVTRMLSEDSMRSLGLEVDDGN
ncbi:MAG: ParB N-terminal domain-containing protein [Leucobacter sp.]